jgi:hypothetical protein
LKLPRPGWLKRIYVELREAGVFALLLLPLLPVLMLIMFVWLWLDDLLWVTITCPDCRGTGICQQPGSTEVHSCCGDCQRIPATAWASKRGLSLIGDGKVLVRPWSAVRRLLTGALAKPLELPPS